MPAIRYPPTESPVVRMLFVTTPDCERTRYGEAELLGPVIAPPAAHAAPARAAAPQPNARSFFVKPYSSHLGTRTSILDTTTRSRFWPRGQSNGATRM